MAETQTSGGLWSRIKNVASSAWNSIKAPFVWVGSKVKGVADATFGLVKGTITGTKAVVTGLTTAVSILPFVIMAVIAAVLYIVFKKGVTTPYGRVGR